MSKPLLYETLKVLLREPIVILVKGGWRKGKTDTSLLCAYLAKKWGLIDKIGSNIWTYNNPDVDYIIRLGKLRKWFHADKLIKLYLFDEALVHVPRRTAMSHKNISTLKLLAELSKGHGRMFFISQITKLDSDILNPEFCRATWEKKSKKVMLCRSRHHPPRTFRNLPRSPIRFDKDRLAPFIDTDMSSSMIGEQGGKVYEICSLYARGFSFRQIEKEKGIHPEETKRAIKKGLKFFLENYEGSEGGNLGKYD